MQIWTNIWKKRESAQNATPDYYSSAKHSFDEAMQDLQDSGEQFSVPYSKYNHFTKQVESFRQYYDYICTQFSAFDKSGNVSENKTYTDLFSLMDNWSYETLADAIAYRSAGTLAASQLCNMGGGNVI